MANFTPQEIEQMLQEFFDTVGKRQYVGARYVPVFGRHNSGNIDWDNRDAYEPLTIVYYNGDTYTSKKYVPAGIDISDTDYWVITGRYNAQVEQYRQEVLSFQGQIDTLRNDMELDYVPFPDSSIYPKYGQSGQVLSTLSDGNTKWEDPVTVDAEIAEPLIDAWLDDHPEATTTVEDGAITTPKITDGAVTDDKLASGGIKGLAIDTSRRVEETSCSNEVTIEGSMAIGYGLASSGYIFEDAERAACLEYIYVHDIEYIRYDIENGYRLFACFYDEDKEYLSNFGWVTSSGRTSIPSSAYYIRFCKAVVDDDHTITESELSNVRVYYANKVYRDSNLYKGSLESNADLNNVRIIGTYNIPHSNVSTMSNTPTALYGGTLIVTYGYNTISAINNTAQAIQIIVDPFSNAIHMRYASTDYTWHDWITFDKSVYEDSLRYKGQIAANSDLDTVMQIGMYRIRTADGPTISNMPFDAVGGTLIVYYGFSGVSSSQPGQFVQLLLDPYTGVAAMRFASNSNQWRNWTNISGIGGQVPNGADLDDYLTVGSYSVNKQQVSYQVSNLPSGFTGGSLIVSYGYNLMSGTAHGEAVQMMISPDDNAIAIRRSYNGSFNSWLTIRNDSLTNIVERTKWLALGDSITYGVYSTGASTSAVGDGWPKQLANALGYEYYNAGVRGMGYVAVGGNGITLEDKLTEIEALTETYNLVTVALGINDYNTSTVTIAQIETKIATVVQRLTTKFPKARIVFITPFNACNRGDASSNYDLDHDNTDRSLRDIATAIIAKCEELCVECINATEAFLFNNYNIQTLELDGVHPSADAHKLIAKSMAHHLFY